MSREIKLLEKQLAFWKHHAASLTKALDEAEQTATRYSQLLDKTEEELNAERVQREDVTDINVGNKSEWISVDERFPEEAGRAYLVWDNVQATVKKRFFYRIPLNMPVETYPYIREYFGNVSDHKRYTHWMPLPEAPKMKGDSHTEQWTFTILGDNGLPESFTKTVKKGGAG